MVKDGNTWFKHVKDLMLENITSLFSVISTISDTIMPQCMKLVVHYTLGV